MTTLLIDIQNQLHMPTPYLQWIINAYFFTLSVCMLSVGRFANKHGHRNILYIGIFISICGAIGTGLADTGDILISFRVIQGLGTAIILPTSVALLKLNFTETQTNKAMGIFSMFIGGGFSFGPFIGSMIITTLGLSWNFFISAIITGIGFCFTLFTLKKDASYKEISIDYIGMLFLTITFGSLVYGFTEADSVG